MATCFAMPCCAPVIAGFPGLFISVFFTGTFLIENIFSLDGMGLLGFESVINRDYPVVFGTAYVFSSLISLVVYPPWRHSGLRRR